MRIGEYFRPRDLREAFEALNQSPRNAAIAGMTALKYAGRDIGTAVDLAPLGLDHIKEENGELSIGAMTNLRTIETSALCLRVGSGALSAAVGRIGGVQLRNLATLGGAVASRWPVSDTLAMLLALGAELRFHRAGRLSLEAYLAAPIKQDILTDIVVPAQGRSCAQEAVRRSYTDFPLLTVAVALTEGPLGATAPATGAAPGSLLQDTTTARIVVGARPGGAAFAPKAMEAWTAGADIAEVGRVAASEIAFGDDARASAQYRREVCPVLVARAMRRALGGADSLSGVRI